MSHLSQQMVKPSSSEISQMQLISPEESSASSGVTVEFTGGGGCEGPEGERMVGFSVIIFRRNSLSAASSSRGEFCRFQQQSSMRLMSLKVTAKRGEESQIPKEDQSVYC